ncbi:MAG: hypothetical protein NVSMB21_18810 [Vulcanimicrobiaceae bacterium]
MTSELASECEAEPARSTDDDDDARTKIVLASERLPESPETFDRRECEAED